MRDAPTQTDPVAIQRLIDDIVVQMRPRLGEGKVADYIPQLAKIDPTKFGVAVALLSGETLTAGDADEPFSVQSVTKVFTLTMALGKIGDDLWRRVGREPSGSPFKSIVQLEREDGIPRNPFINAGAILLADVLLAGRRPREAIGEILLFARALAGDDAIFIDGAVARSESETGFTNVALANFMKAHGNLDHRVSEVLGVYFHQCALAMSAAQLARAGIYLANAGRDPRNGLAIVSAQRARRLCALMLTCGHYDGSGDFAYRVGLPAKSGVGGGILAVVAGVGTLAVWSPGLNANGNSLLGSEALELLAQRAGWSVF